MTDTELRDEIQSGALVADLAPLVAVRADSAIAAALNETRNDITITVPIDKRRIIKYLTAEHRLRGIYEAAANPSHDAREEAWNTRYVLEAPAFPYIDLSDDDAQAEVGALVASGLLTGPNVAALQAMGQRPGSRIEQLEGAGAVVTVEQVSRALNEEASGA